MGNITPVEVSTNVGYVIVTKWANVTQAGSDVGLPALVGHLLFLSAFIKKNSGTLTSVELQGSADGATWGTLGTSAFTLTTDGQTRAIVDPPLYIRPANPTGASLDCDIYVVGKRAS